MKRLFVSDFETTVYEGQDNTEVWAAALLEIKDDSAPVVFNSIASWFDYIIDLKCNCIIYFQNLKFDGSFILNYLLRSGYTQAYVEYKSDEVDYKLFKTKYRIIEWTKNKFMKHKSFKYTISYTGQWYKILIKYKKYFIEIRDSLKLLPFSVKKIGEDFGTAHKKLEIDYEGYRKEKSVITETEEEYIKNDVYVPKEALEIMFSKGHDKLTIGSCCLYEFKRIFTSDCIYKKDAENKWEEYFPDLYNFPLDKNIYGSSNADEYIRKSYRGGWCYLVEGKENKKFTKGITLDVNSLYPSMMHSESGNRYPVKLPTFFKGEIPEKIRNNIKYYYFVRIKCSFNLKENYLPYIQIKRNLLYDPTDMLKTSDIYDKQTDRYYKYLENENGKIEPVTVTITLTMTDFEIILKHYDLTNFEILDGCYFSTLYGLFDDYIDIYKDLKMNSKGAVRELAKLFLNNLYGKFAANNNSSFKLVRVEEGVLKFDNIIEFDKKSGYIPIGSAITSYSRCFTITAAQLNYHGKDSPGFIYADTDSIHCDLPPQEIKGVKMHPTNFCCWKVENYWDVGWFVRAKTYIEHVVETDKGVVDPYYNIKCAGMPNRCKMLFEYSISNEDEKIKILKNIGGVEKLSKEELEFINQNRTLNDFTIGLSVPGKLVAKQIKGGVVLSKTTYVMHK